MNRVRYFSALVTSGPVTVEAEPVAGGGPGRLVELGEGGELAHPRLLGGGAQVVAVAVVLAAALVLGLHGQTGERVDLLLRLRAGHGERGQEQPPGGGGLLHGSAEGERGTGRRRRRAAGSSGELVGERRGACR